MRKFLFAIFSALFSVSALADPAPVVPAFPATILDFINAPASALASVKYRPAPNAYDVSGGAILAPGTLYADASGIHIPGAVTNASPWSSGSTQLYGMSTGTTVPAMVPDNTGFYSQLSDDFHRADTSNGSIGGAGWTLLGPYVSPTWPPATNGRIQSNKFVADPNNVVYAWQHSTATITHLKSNVTWTSNGGSGQSATAAIIISPNGQPTNSIHIQCTRIGPIIGIFTPGGLVNLANGHLSTIPADGTTVTNCEMSYDPLTNTVTVTEGSVTISATDSRFATYAGPYACWEIYQPGVPGVSDSYDTVSYSLASYGVDNPAAVYTSTSNGGHAYANFTVPQDTGTHAIAAIVPKSATSQTVAFSALIVGGTNVESDWDFDAHTGIFSTNNGPVTGAPAATVTDLGVNGWLAIGYVKNNNTAGNTTMQVQFAPGGRSGTGSAALQMLNVQLGVSSLTSLVKTYGAAAARGTDSITVSAPNGQVLGQASIGSGSPVGIDAAASGGSGFTLPSALRGQAVRKMLLY
jgi:hypothetical protein